MMFQGLEFWADYPPTERAQSRGGDPITFRLPRNFFPAIEEARIMERPIASRSDVIREALDFWLKSKGLLK